MKCKKILRKENFLLTEAPTRFYFLLNFVRRRNVDTEFTTKEKTLSSWQLPYFVLSTILIEFPQLFSHSSFWHFEHSLHSTVSITLLDDGRVCKLRKIWNFVLIWITCKFWKPDIVTLRNAMKIMKRYTGNKSYLKKN